MRLSRFVPAAFLLISASALISCADAVSPEQPAEATAAPSTVASPDLLDGLTSTVTKATGLLSCSPLPTVTVTQIVGKNGGTINIGPHSLSIPKGALSGNVKITAYAPSGNVNRVEFQPHGLTFARNAALTMSYANCEGVGSKLPKSIAYVDGKLNILYFLETIDNFKRRTVAADLEHFSEYAVAW